MSVTVPISKRFAPLPIGTSFAPDDYVTLLMRRMELFLSGDNVLVGNVISVSAPSHNIGPWMDASSAWWTWNDDAGTYLPIAYGAINGSSGLNIVADPSAHRTLTLPDATGTALLEQDIAIPAETVVLTSSGGTVSSIDANISNNFFLALSENSTIPSISNMSSGSGKKIRIGILNNGTSYTVTWPSSGANEIKWPATPSHTQPAATSAQSQAFAIYTISEANVGLTAHLWGDPEVSGFSSPGVTETGGSEDAPDVYLPPASHNPRTPYTVP